MVTAFQYKITWYNSHLRFYHYAESCDHSMKHKGAVLLLGVYVSVYRLYVEWERGRMLIDAADYVIVEVRSWPSALKLRRQRRYKLLKRKILGRTREEPNSNKEDESATEKGITAELGNGPG